MASISEVFDNPPAHATYSEMARRIRLDLDKKMHGGSRGWSVVVGRAFGAYITQKIKNYAYVSVFPGAWRGGGGRGRGRLRARGVGGGGARARARSKQSGSLTPLRGPLLLSRSHRGQRARVEGLIVRAVPGFEKAQFFLFPPFPFFTFQIARRP